MVTVSTITSFFLLLCSILIGKKYYENCGLFNPLVIFFLVWSFVLSCYYLDHSLNFFYYKTTFQADCFLSLGLLFFFVGGVFPLIVSSSCNYAESFCVFDLKNNININRIYYISLTILILFIFSVIAKYIILSHHYNDVMYSFDKIRKDSLDNKFTFPFYFYFFTFPAYLLIVNMGILTVIKKSKVMFLLGFVTIITAFFDSMFVGMRGKFVNFVFLFFFSFIMSYIIIGGKVTVKHYLYCILFVLFVLFILSLGIYIRLDHSQHGLFVFFALLFRINFIYITGVIPSYSYFLTHPWPTYYPGAQTFYSIYKLIDVVIGHIFSLIGLHSHTNDIFLGSHSYTFAPITYVGAFNSTSYLTYLQSDFGLYGMLFASMLFGLVSQYLFLIMLKRKRMIDIQIIAIIFYGIVISHRSMFTTGIWWLVLFLLICLQNKFASKKEYYS